VKDSEGNTVSVNIAPWTKLEKDYFDQLAKCCTEFGLTPVSRSSVEKIVRGEKVNPFAGVTT
jgi:phage terminase small subunit